MITTMPVVFAALEYSLIYMLLGGGVVGAAVVYVVARAFNK